jgi:DNA-directed RNA polymerase subunit RPC12/RpoP
VQSRSGSGTVDLGARLQRAEQRHEGDVKNDASHQGGRHSVILAKPGGWYFFVACASCGKPIMFKEASSLEEDEQPAGATLTCPHCGAEHSYLASQVQRGRVDEKGA